MHAIKKLENLNIMESKMFNATRKIIILCGCLAMALMLSIQVYAISPRIDPPDAFGAFRVGSLSTPCTLTT